MSCLMCLKLMRYKLYNPFKILLTQLFKPPTGIDVTQQIECFSKKEKQKLIMYNLEEA